MKRRLPFHAKRLLDGQIDNQYSEDQQHLTVNMNCQLPIVILGGGGGGEIYAAPLSPWKLFNNTFYLIYSLAHSSTDIDDFRCRFCIHRFSGRTDGWKI